MAEDGINDFYIAKKKALTRLGMHETRHLPGNDEIERELVQYQRLFQAQTQPQHLQQLRQQAYQAMRLLADFQPRLVGPVLLGSAGQHSPIELHLFASTSEEVAMFLLHHDIPYQSYEERVRFTKSEQLMPAFRFIAGEETILLVVFPEGGPRHAPRSPIDGKPMHRASMDEVAALLEEEVLPTD